MYATCAIFVEENLEVQLWEMAQPWPKSEVELVKTFENIEVWLS